MNTMIINFLRASSSHRHCLQREFLEDVEAEANANDLLLHNNVRWLIRGNLLGCFWSIRKEITAFLKQVKSQRATEFSFFLQDEHKMDMAAFFGWHQSTLKNTFFFLFMSYFLKTNKDLPELYSTAQKNNMFTNAYCSSFTTCLCVTHIINQTNCFI